ncbi:hypothetical protein [Methylobacterium bullatum]|uniref:Uncharacterized protein n=1 Tax=Methylobacterium bullatum TaxID=570505 RepID=A0AAV4ZEC5_9HYPH|nr:hypothetical protein [Methylobacterium bullatum]GJD41953.1 hypothetical protein OICFNHDK_4439 [Methylobacterium bullatum]
MKRQWVTRKNPTGNRPPGIRNGNAALGVGAQNGEIKGVEKTARQKLYHTGKDEQAGSVDRVVEADRLFFARHLGRTCRVRIASAAEIAEFGASVLPFGLRWFVVVRQVQPGARLRVLFPSQADDETDVTEARCVAIYEAVRGVGCECLAAFVRGEALS